MAPGVLTQRLVSADHRAADAATVSASCATRSVLTLRAKGVLALIVLSIYAAAFALYVAREQQRLLHIVQQLEYAHAQQESLLRINAFVSHSISALQLILNAQSTSPRFEDSKLDIGAIMSALPQLKERIPEISATVASFERRIAEAANTPTTGTLIALQDITQHLNARLKNVESTVAERTESLSRQYRQVNQSTTETSVALSLLGLLLFGGAATIFFTKLATDIRQLESRAVAIAGGCREQPLEIGRHDEVGGLMQAINRMQSALRDWEEQREISRQQHFHQEKKAAVGSLAAAVAHEVSNPLAAIVGIAQRLIDTHQSSVPPDAETIRGQAKLIVDHSQRIVSTMRQVSDLRGHSSPQPALLDLNALVKATCSFIGYDKRFAGIDLVPDVAAGLPAVKAVADQLTQILMNLLINAADSTEGMQGRKPAISVRTAAADGEVILSVQDNGCGMEPAVLSRAFDEWYSTKPADQGRGIGLFLCKALIEQNGGRIELQSSRASGTVARVFVPSPNARSASQGSS